jgi:DNA-binding NarL/FixJ family response regulator
METVRVVIADDQAPARRGLKAVLNLFPAVEVIGEAADGEEVVHLVEALHPNMVVMDVQMPGMNGLEATHQIKRNWPEVRVVVLTLHAGHRTEALAVGADAFLLKGCPMEELRAAVSRAP